MALSKGFAPQQSNLKAMPLQNALWTKNNIYDCFEILAEKAAKACE